jgi:hypothetical protein
VMTGKELKSLAASLSDSATIFVDSEELEDFVEVGSGRIDSDGDLILQAELPETQDEEEEDDEEDEE